MYDFVEAYYWTSIFEKLVRDLDGASMNDCLEAISAWRQATDLRLKLAYANS